MTVDPAEVVKAITHQGQLIGAHEMHLISLEAKLDQLTAMIKTLLPSCPEPVWAPAPIQAISLVPPKYLLLEKFGGEDCRGFPNICCLHFCKNPETFSTPSAKVTFVIFLLMGK